MPETVFRFDGESWCVVFCRPNSDVVQMTSNIPDEECAISHVERLRADGYHVFRACPAGVLIAALELIKTPAIPQKPHWIIGHEVQGKYRGKLMHGRQGTVIEAFPPGHLGIKDPNGVLAVLVEPNMCAVGGADQFVTA